MPDSDQLQTRNFQRLERERRARAEAEGIAYEALERMRLQAQRSEEHAAELQRALDRAREAEAVRTKLVNSVAHVLRTPLTALIMQAHVAGTKATGPAVEHIEKVQRSAKSLNGVVNDLVRVTQLDAGMITVEPVEVDLHAWVYRQPGLELQEHPNQHTTVFSDPDILDEIYAVMKRMTGQKEIQASIPERQRTTLRLTLPPSEVSHEGDALGLGAYLMEQLGRAIDVGVVHGADSLGRPYCELEFSTNEN